MNPKLYTCTTCRLSDQTVMHTLHAHFELNLFGFFYYLYYS